MSRLAKQILIGLVVVLVLVMGVLVTMSIFSGKPTNLGVVDGRLADCPASPNCVSTQARDAAHQMDPIAFTGSPDEAMREIHDVITRKSRSRIVTEQDNYLHVEFRSALFRFVDDVEFFVDSREQVIHFRSASRVGHSDLGVNRRRMEQIQAALDQ